jgi:hypothetical protein
MARTLVFAVHGEGLASTSRAFREAKQACALSRRAMRVPVLKSRAPRLIGHRQDQPSARFLA